jgi:DNA ligase-associated metallophosphoesterase
MTLAPDDGDSAAGDLALDLAGATVRLCPEAAMHWPAVRTVLIADPHLGKGACFRAAGIPVPAGSGQTTLATLSRLIARTAAERLIVLGDLFHGPAATEATALDPLRRWLAAHRQLAVELIPGNHDATAGLTPAELGLIRRPPGAHEPPFVLHHAPEPDERGYVLAGHVHPAARLDDAGASFRVPCFHLGPTVGVLPAFGQFTGMHTVRPGLGERLYPILAGRVIAPPCDAPGPQTVGRNRAAPPQRPAPSPPRRS